jgi:hypothetical protein
MGIKKLSQYALNHFPYVNLLTKIDVREIGESLSYQLLKVLSQKRLREFNSYSDSLNFSGVLTVKH